MKWLGLDEDLIVPGVPFGVVFLEIVFSGVPLEAVDLFLSLLLLFGVLVSFFSSTGFFSFFGVVDLPK
jgi:hypothetical protein